MSEVMNFLDRHDLDRAKACFHDEFMFLRWLEILTIDDMSENFQELIYGKLTSIYHSTQQDDEHSAAYTHDFKWNENIRCVSAGTVITVRVGAWKKMTSLGGKWLSGLIKPKSALKDLPL